MFSRCPSGLYGRPQCGRVTSAAVFIDSFSTNFVLALVDELFSPYIPGDFND